MTPEGERGVFVSTQLRSFQYPSTRATVFAGALGAAAELLKK
jgi:hypothetical protein